MTKDALLERAKTLGIRGRHDLSRDDLATAVMQREMLAEVSTAAKETKTLAHGRRLVRNTNLPWKRKYYFVDAAKYAELAASGVMAKAPGQVQLLLKFMVREGVTSAKTARQGVDVAGDAINTGAVNSVIEPQVLYAYYVQRMLKLGLVFAGYDVGETEDAETETEVEDDTAEDETDDGDGE